MFVLIYIAMQLGYYISPSKSTVFPTQDMVHLGFGINAQTSSFYIAPKCRRKFTTFLNELLTRRTANLLDMQRWVGKCNHLGLVFPAFSLFTYEVRQFMSTLGDERVAFPPSVLKEISFWSFVAMRTEPVPFRKQQHVTARLSTDASGFAWGASVNLPSGPVELRDYWSSSLLSHDICVKEALAVFFCLQAIREHLFDRRVDVFVDNEGLVHAWQGLRSRSAELVEVLKSLFLFCVDNRLSLKLIWISTKENPADAPSRALDRGDSTLSDRLRRLLWRRFGPFSFDLMALPSNAFRGPDGRVLPFFSRFPLPSSRGANVFAQSAPVGRLYVFPPFCLIVPVIRLLMEWGAPDAVIVLPVRDSRPASWLHLLRPFILDELVLSVSGEMGVLRYPSSQGFQDALLPVPFGLSAFRCRFPPVPAPVPPPPVAPVRVLFLGDSVIRALEKLVWPSPWRVWVYALSGASLRRIVERGISLSDRISCDVVVLHGGVNDASKAVAPFEDGFRAACSHASRVIPVCFPGRRVFVSTACVSRSVELNGRVLVVNQMLRELASSASWTVVSNDNISTSDLIDDVHLNAAGTARLFSNIVNALRA